MFQLNHITLAYEGGVVALRDVSLHIERGSAVALTGPNGCGKTTLLRVLNGLLFPKSGEYRFDGKLINKETLRDANFSKEFHGRVGYVFQNVDAQLFCGSVEDEIAFGPRQLDMNEDELRARVDDCLKLLGIEKLRTRAPYALSGGEKRKTAFAAVLALNPDALVMDEPLSGLDRDSQALVLDLLKALKKAGKTLAFATHNEALVSEVADRRVVCDDFSV